MSEGKGSKKEREYDRSLPNSIGWIFYSAMETYGNFLVKKECLKNLEYSPETEEFTPGSQGILFGVLTTVAWLQNLIIDLLKTIQNFTIFLLRLWLFTVMLVKMKLFFSSSIKAVCCRLR